LPTDARAPWAEAVPGAVCVTADDLTALPDDTWLYELVEGRLVRVPPVGFEHGDLETELAAELRNFVRVRALGRVVTGEAGFHLSAPGEPDTVLGADVAFIAAERIPQRGTREWRAFPRLAPDLVVEIASPGQGRRELATKARMWMRSGVRLLWVIWPDVRQVEVWQAGANEPVVTLWEQDHLDGGDVLPGFRHAVSQLFT